jgi:AraC family transcriptional regulator, regulatory protein of adaptative response / DNA-3-methyladenine glycosylase II
MRHAHTTLYARLLASDPTWDGRFFTGVLTTGIYCLPSCRARKPRPENVRFFPTCDAARAAGLRACRKCHPDDYAHGTDPVREVIEQVALEVRTAPEQFSDAAAVVRRTGYGATRAGELFRHHFHLSPGELLARARLAALQTRLLASPRVGIAEAAEAAGYASLSVVHEQVRARLGMTPAAWRALADPEERSFTVSLPPGYPSQLLLGLLGRDPESRSERVEGRRATLAVRLGGRPARLVLEFTDAEIRARVVCAEDPPAGSSPALLAHRLTVHVAALGEQTEAFVRQVERLGLRRLVAGREGWAGGRAPGMWDALSWAILGQQINLAFAFRLRRELADLAGAEVGEGLRVPPGPAAVAELDADALRARKFSGPKARTLIDVAGRVARGEIDLDALAAGSATRAARTLLEIRGLGPWTVNYVLMRGAGFADCVPYGDTGVTSGLEALLALERRPDADATRRLMLPLAPWRSLATAHLWQLNRSPGQRDSVSDLS